ncbi:MAG: glycine zipper family protein [Sedimentisphaerales bacterium]|nr:glycine zipper family protein [Sedimentisphaerales bacterium]
MKTKNGKKTQILLVLTTIILIFSSGCGEQMKLKPIYDRAILGALIGGIVGYQSDETGEGAAIGASVLALGEILSQIDNQPGRQTEPKHENGKKPVSGSIIETYIIEIHNENGSITPVEIRKEGDGYVGPTGEHYEKLPTEEQLKPIYGL